MNLVLQNRQGGRRTGLSRNVGSSLLKNINSSAVQNRTEMPRAVSQRATAEVNAESTAKRARDEEEDINRPPDSDSDSDEEFRRANNEDIKATVFVTAAEKREEQKEKNDGVARGRKEGAATAMRAAPTNGRPRRGKGSPTSTHSTSSPKRKSQEDVKPLGAGMADIHGRVSIKKRRTTQTFQKRKPSQASLEVASGLRHMILFILKLS